MIDEYEVDTSEEAFAKAKERGLVVVTPKPNELLVDIDSEDDMRAFQSRVRVFERHLCALGWDPKREWPIKVAPSKSGKPGRFHVTVTLDRNVTDTERVIFQLMLGSDRVRELLSYARILKEDPIPTLFFELPGGSR